MPALMEVGQEPEAPTPPAPQACGHYTEPSWNPREDVAEGKP